MKGKKRFLILLVIILIVIGVGSTLYIILSKDTEKTEGLIVGETEFSLNDLFDTSELITVEEYQGVSLAEIIDKTGIENPEAQEYTIIAEDGYQKTVEWESIKEGIFTSEKRVIFPDLPQQYWIKNTIKIEIREK